LRDLCRLVIQGRSGAAAGPPRRSCVSARCVDRLLGHRTGQELVDQLLRDRWQLAYVAFQFPDFARHDTPPWRRLCLAHRITDRLVSRDSSLHPLPILRTREVP